MIRVLLLFLPWRNQAFDGVGGVFDLIGFLD